jgi:two-component system sensor histidine kinase KdpD
LREQADAARSRVRTTEALYAFARRLSATGKLDDVLWAVASQIAAAGGRRAVVFLPTEGDLAVRGTWPPDDILTPGDWAAARWAFRHCEATGWRTATLPNATMQFRPLTGSTGTIGVVGVEPPDPGEPWSSEDERALAALIDQSAVAIERAELVEEIASNRAVVEGEKLRAALLSAISHDLRTPLAAILGAVTSIRSLGAKLTDEVRADLLDTIEEEAGRLDRFVANLLDMTRLEAGVLDVRRDWVDLRDVLHAALARLAAIYPDRSFQDHVVPGLPLVRLDAVLFEQVLVNILDNAAKHAPSGGLVEIDADVIDGHPVVSVTDTGPGIAGEDLPRIFDKFYRARRGDQQPPGTGLGLAIVKGLVEAMGGTVSVHSPVAAGHGTKVSVILDVDTADPSSGARTAA